MGSAVSIYLDALRFFAAFVVFLSHYSTHGFSGGVLWQLQPYGRTAVLVFFVLSGVIIAWVTEKREATLREFAASRIARIYSVVLPALAVTAVLDALAPPAAPELSDSVTGFMSSFLFMDSSWNLALHPGSDLPFWSLNYEVWYYVLFGSAIFLRNRTRQIALALAALLAGPKILLLFPIWLMGAGVWRWRARVPEKMGPILAGIAASAFLALELAGGQQLFLRASTPWLTDQYSAYDYIVGVLVAVFILGLSRSRLPEPSRRIGVVIRWLAGASFGLYLLHYPFLRFFSDVLPWSHDNWTYRIVLFALSLSASIALARIFEQTKDAYRTALHRSLYYFRARLAATGRP